MFEFQKLQVYQKSKENYLSLNKLVKNAGFNSLLRDKLANSALEILLNIARSSSTSNSSGQKVFFERALMEVLGCIAIVDLLKDNNEMDEFTYLDYYGKLEEIARMLEKIIRKL